MAQVQIEFETDNAAFEGHGYGRECRRILTKLAARFDDAAFGGNAAMTLDGTKVMDLNGNTVGRVTVKE